MTGLAGVTGIGSSTGIQGNTGIQGFTGLAYGATGLVGSTGIQGLTGFKGDQGFTGLACGSTGLCGVTGLQGIEGQTGIQGSGQTGLQGLTGLSPSSSFFNPISRYQVTSTSGAEVWAVSSSTVFHDLTWDRSGTVLNIYRNTHGHAVGNRVIVRNTNLDYQEALIDTTTSNSFAVTTSSVDGTAGANGAYSLGFTYAHNGSPASGGTLYAPSGDHTDSQILSMRIRTGARPSTIYSLVVPASAVNGAGANTSLSDCYIPDFNIRMDSDGLSAIAATINTNISSSYSTFQFGNLGSGSLSRMIILHF
jgi:hypothetical protein